jgi:ribosomal protein L37AE/L43A
MPEPRNNPSPIQPGEVQPADRPRCDHARKRLIAKDEDAEYWECLICGEVFEPGGDGEVVNLDGSLSDA